jgi:hypothetical protein
MWVVNIYVGRLLKFYHLISDISLLSLINVRCFKVCQVLGVHLFEIGCHWSFFLLSFLFPFLLGGGFTLGFFG